MATSTRRALAARVPPRRLLAVLGIWMVAVAGAVLLADRLDDPVGASRPDAAQPVVGGDIAVPGQVASGGAGGSGGLGTGAAEERLPPLAMVLQAPLPSELRALAPDEQVRRLRVEAGLTADPRLLLQLGALNQRLGRHDAARAAFGDALRVDPGNLAAQVGLAMSEGAAGPSGLERAESTLARLAREHPNSQLVAFNRGWLAVYRQDGPTARAAWERAVSLGADTNLGTVAQTLLRAGTGDPTGTARP